tara:strand:+ start:187 stop:1101 length:915 start_codon:yes stop_codon:yes gene_type:complete
MSKKFSPLRYPNARIDTDSDFLEIRVVEYKPPGFELGSQAGQGLSLGTSTDALQENIENPLGFIFLPIPETIQDSNAVSWGDDSINGLAAAGLKATKSAIESGNIAKGLFNGVKDFGGNIVDAVGDKTSQDLTSSFFASKAVNILGGNTSLDGVLSRSSGQIVNPNMELLFNGVTLRSFSFNFDLAPRDEKESDTIKKMLRIFKQNMQAKKSADGGSNTSGLFLRSPNVFQLNYKTGRRNHNFLHKFKPMALLNMAVNYTGGGTYATYDDTTPVHMKLDLSFQELNPVYSEDYDSEEGKEGVGF